MFREMWREAGERAKMANFIIKIGKDVEIGAEEFVKWAAKVPAATPAALASLAVLAGGVEKCLMDVSAAESNPLQALLGAGTDIKDFAALWPESKALIISLGIKI
jgi:hypothetical protein